MKNYILFDLDGTLTDPQEGITNSVAYALEKYGIYVEDRAVLNKFIGPPLAESFVNYYGFTKEEAKNVVKKYREYFEDRGMFQNVVYEGMKELLEGLHKSGKKLIVATSKPTIYAKQIIEHFGLDSYFQDIQGSNMDGSRVDKAEVIQYALEQNKIANKAEAIMVGDRKHDINGGKKCGLDTIGVLYGYGDLEEMQECRADQIVKNVEELKELLWISD